MSDIEKILILAGTLWITAVGFIVFSWILEVKRQQALIFIAKRLISLEKKVRRLSGESDPTTTSVDKKDESVIDIPKTAPLSAYEAVTLPDDADIHFVDEHAP